MKKEKDKIMRKTDIYVSILSADIKNIDKELKKIEKSSKGIHIDVMDGKFVKNKTSFTPDFVKNLKTKLKKTAHLMVIDPDKKVIGYAKVKPECIIFHIESTKEPSSLIKKIRSIDKKIKIGISIKPKTGVKEIMPFLKMIDEVLIMSVEPGSGGQKFLNSALKKIREIRSIDKKIDISVDGGINPETATKCIKAGANILVSGSYIFHSKDYEKAIKSLKKD